LNKLFYICRISRLGLYYLAQLLTPPGKSARFAEQILLTVNTNIRLVWGNLKSQREAKEVGLEKNFGARGKVHAIRRIMSQHLPHINTVQKLWQPHLQARE